MSEGVGKHTASIEVLAGIIRVHAEGCGYGDTYSYHCAYTVELDVVCLHGADVAPTPSEARAMVLCFRKAGYREARWARVKDGVAKWHFWRLT